jgi:adenylate kinase family enzyme
MVKNKLMEAQHGWLLDGYPRSLSQAQALEAFDIHPQLFILLEVIHAPFTPVRSSRIMYFHLKFPI